uniref:Uncharacterized protein n=1 Tax=Laticauda laticaudata TaxID=8630 RepID=A0A8C5SDE6_LATLA
GGAEGGGPPHLEVLRVHVQPLAVQLAQLGEGLLDAVQVLDGLSEGADHLLPVDLDQRVGADGAGPGEVPEVGEEPLGPRIHHQEPGGPADFGQVHLAPKGGDQLLLFETSRDGPPTTPEGKILLVDSPLPRSGPCPALGNKRWTPPPWGSP